MKPISIGDLMTFNMLSGLTISPDGEHIALVASNPKLSENAYKKHIYLASTKTAKFKKLTAGGAEGSFIWLDNSHLLFPRMVEKADKELVSAGEELTVFCSIDINGGEAVELFRVSASATGIKKIDDENFLITARHDMTRPDVTGLKGDERARVIGEYKKEKQSGIQVCDEVPFWFNGMGFTNKLRNRLYTYNIISKKLTPITQPNFNAVSTSISEDGSFVLFTGTAYDRFYAKRLDGMFKYNMKTGEVEAVIENGTYNIGHVILAGDRVIFTASLWPDDFAHLSDDMYSVCLNTKKVDKILSFNEDYGCALGSDVRLGGGKSSKYTDRLYMLTSFDHKSGLSFLDNGKFTHITNRDGICFDQFDIEGSTCFAVGMSDTALQEVYKIDVKTGAYKCVSTFNKKALDGKYIAPAQPLSFVNKAGVRIDGWVLAPIDYDPKKKYPMVLQIHGGPRASFGAVFNHEMQVMASKGCFVIFCNPRGGSTRGHEFADLKGKWGTIDYEDLMAFTDEAIKAYPAIDIERLCVAGGSYGGYMTNWVIGQTKRFKAAISMRSISNWGPFGMVGDINIYSGLREMQGDLWHDEQGVWNQSPLKYVNNAVTPTLFIHSFEDYRCPTPEPEQMFRAMNDNGVAAKIVFFKRENHELSRSGEPRHRVRRLDEICDWMDKYLI